MPGVEPRFPKCPQFLDEIKLVLTKAVVNLGFPSNIIIIITPARANVHEVSRTCSGAQLVSGTQEVDAYETASMPS